MAKFKLNWNLDGFRGKLHTAGSVIEANMKDVGQFVAKERGGQVEKTDAAVLTQVDDSTPVTEPTVAPGSDVDLSLLNKQQLVEHADEYHDITLSPTTSKPAMIAQIEGARAAAESLAGGSGSDKYGGSDWTAAGRDKDGFPVPKGSAEDVS